MKPLKIRTNSRIEAGKKINEAEILIYDELGYYGISAGEFAEQLKAIGKVDQITLGINSPGGDAPDGQAIFNTLVRHPARVITRIDGMALSAASLVAMAGDRIEMAQNAHLMIHSPWMVSVGNAETMRKAADILDSFEMAYAQDYSARRNLGIEDVLEAMRAETWYSAEQAVEASMADAVLEVPAAAGHVAKDRYRHTPPQLLGTEPYTPPPPQWRLAAAERETRLTERRRRE